MKFSRVDEQEKQKPDATDIQYWVFHVERYLREHESTHKWRIEFLQREDRSQAPCMRVAMMKAESDDSTEESFLLSWPEYSSQDFDRTIRTKIESAVLLLNGKKQRKPAHRVRRAEPEEESPNEGPTLFSVLGALGIAGLIAAAKTKNKENLNAKRINQASERSDAIKVQSASVATR